jgi:hypothetical protein
MKVLTLPTQEISPDVRAAVLTALDNHYPFVMVARRPNGHWELSEWIPDTNRYEAAGALAHAQHKVLYDENDEG